MPERRHMILCTVTDVRDSQVVYPCCAQCCSKLRSDCFQNRWQCLKCGYTSTNETLEWRYRLSLMVSDGADLANICVFGSILQQYFGMPPNEFVRFLRKIESLYGNSEDVLMLGLKHCFLGKHYYFGMKASSSRSNNSRTCLADVITSKQKLTACQNAIFSQEDSSSTVAFQMVSAVDKEHSTVYSIIKNLFTDSEEESYTVHRESGNNYLSQMSKTDQSNVDAEHFERSHPENSCVTLGQTTALLSCEMSDFDKTNTASTAKSKQSFINSSEKRFSKNENSITNTNKKSPKFKCHDIDNADQEKKSTRCLFLFKDKLDSVVLDNKQSTKVNYGETNSEPLFSEDEGTDFSPDTRNQSDMETVSAKLNLSLEPNFNWPKDLKTKPCKIERDSLRSNIRILNTDGCKHNLYSDSEPLFSQDNKLLNDVSFGIDTKQLNSFAHCKDLTINLSHFANKTVNSILDGSQLLRNMKIPDLPENVPDSEELDLYLYNDSDFESDFEDETSISGKPYVTNEQKPMKIETSPNSNMMCNKQLGKKSLTESCIGTKINSKTEGISCKEMKAETVVDERDAAFLNSHSTLGQVDHFDNNGENFDDFFEDSFDDCDNSNKALNIKKIKLFSAKCQYASEIREEPKLPNEHDSCEEEMLDTFPNISNALVNDIKGSERLMQPVGETTNLVETDNILSCAPDFNKNNETELILEFEENLKTGLKPKECSTNDEEQCMEDSADLFSEYNDGCTEVETSFTNMSECYNLDKNCVDNLLENCSELILESQTTESSRQEHITKNDSNNSEVKNSSNVSEVLHLNTSQDLFCDSPVIHHRISRKHLNKNKFKTLSQDRNTAHSVLKTSRKCVQFSHRLSIHRTVQLIDLQMKINPNFNTESTKLTKSCLKRGLDKVIEANQTFMPEASNSKILAELHNSPILNRIKEPLSQDLFSPSPLICIKGTQRPQRNFLDKDQLTTQNEKHISENGNRNSSTPIETESVTVHNDYNSQLLHSVFSESFGDGLNYKENKPDLKSVEKMTNTTDRSSRSPSLFSQSCSLFSFSSSKLSERGDNIFKSGVIGGNSMLSHSVNYSCDLFSPSSVYDISCTHSPLCDMPVKRLFSDKFS